MTSFPLVGGPADGRFLYGEHQGLLFVKSVEGGLVVFREPRENAAPYRLVVDENPHYEYEGASP